MNTIPNDLNPLGKEAEPAAPEQPDPPEGYTRLAFIKGRGQSAWIDTLIVPDGDTGFYWEYLVEGWNNQQGFNALATSGAYYFIPPILSSFGSGFAFGGGWQSLSVSQTNIRAQAWMNYKNDRVVRLISAVDDIVRQNITYGGKGRDFYTARLGYSRNWTEKWDGRIYAAQMTHGDALTRDFLPCVAPDGRVGCWERLTATFFPNGGSLPFICGIETLDQLTALASNLPTVTDTPGINLSLPGEFENDSEVQSYLIKIMAKGWTPNITYRS